MKILSWNIWVDGDFEQIEEFLDSTNADIIGLQEVKDNDPQRDVIGFLTGRGYNHFFAPTEQIWDGKRYRHGPAIFSTFPIVYSEKIQLESGDDERAAAYAQVEVGGTVLHLFSTHLIHTHQQPSVEQEEQMQRLIARLPSERVIVMGDFNATPQSQAIAAMRGTLVDTDTEELPTWCVHPEGCRVCRLDRVDIKLDYIFVSRDIHYGAFEIGKSQASDHLPVFITL